MKKRALSILKSIKTKSLNSDNPIIRSLAISAYKLILGYIYSPRQFKRRYKENMDDMEYISNQFYERFGYELPWNAPETFNEKANWRKIFDRNPEYTKRVDKLELKKIVTKECGDGHVIPLLDYWEKPAEIKIDELPERFVLKANHADGIIVCRNKNTFDLREAKKELKNILLKDYSLVSREWPYKNVERRVLAEEYVGENLIDYKNYCFNGKLLYTFVWKNVSRKKARIVFLWSI